MRDELQIANIAAGLIRQSSELDQARIFQGNTQRPFEVQKITLDLSTARREDLPYKIGFSFRSVFVGAATDTTANVNIKVNSQDQIQSSFPLKRNDSPIFPFSISEAFLHWDAQSGKTMDLYFFVTGEFRSGSQISVNAGGVSISEGDAFTTARVDIASTAFLIRAANTSRKVLSIQNNSTADVWLGPSTVTRTGANLGWKVPAGGSFYWKNTSAIYGIAAAASTGDSGLLYIEET